MLVNGTPTRIVVLSVADITGPAELDAAAVEGLVYVADSLNPLWPGSAIASEGDYAFLEEVITNLPANNYDILYPI